MTDHVTTRPTRDDFIKFIDERLSQDGFIKSSEEESWNCEQDIQTPPQVIIVNGQRHEQPGDVVHVKYGVKVFGDGEMKDVKTETIESFIEIDFWSEKDGVKENTTPTFCMYYDDNMLFNIILNKLFGL